MNLNRVRIKMCGMTSKEDIACAVALGVDAIGLVFYAKSSRYLSIEKANLLISRTPLFVDVVAVMVNPLVAEVKQILCNLPITCLQFHGNETPDFCAQFNKPYIKAIRANKTEDVNEAMQCYEQASAILLDTPSTELWGGTGCSFDWNIIPSQRNIPIILAGGLTSDNIVAAVSASIPYAVDVCSGIEQSPGIKDHAKMFQFVSALKDYDYAQ